MMNMDTQLKKLPGYSNELFNPNGQKTNGYYTADLATPGKLGGTHISVHGKPAALGPVE